MTTKQERKLFIAQAQKAFNSMLKRHIENPDRYGLVVEFHQDPVLVRSPDGPDTYMMGPRVTKITMTEHITREEIIAATNKEV